MLINEKKQTHIPPLKKSVTQQLLHPNMNLGAQLQNIIMINEKLKREKDSFYYETSKNIQDAEKELNLV